MSETYQDAHRLGKRELGRHAFEDQMPQRIAQKIEIESSANKCRDVIPALAALLERDRDVQIAYLCNDTVVQISKIRGEGNHFCGYRNIQMLLSHSQNIYSIPEIQAMIEKAWDDGLNSHGRIETGGIKDTRKHIGTSEAQALLLSLKIPCTAATFSAENAWRDLLDSVEAYFEAHSSFTNRIRVTKAGPIFLQRPRHSLTIVGIERERDGKRKLLVFDPGYQPPSAFRNGKHPSEGSTLRNRLIHYQYQRDERYLKKYRGFETLHINAT